MSENVGTFSFSNVHESLISYQIDIFIVILPRSFETEKLLRICTMYCDNLISFFFGKFTNKLINLLRCRTIVQHYCITEYAIWHVLMRYGLPRQNGKYRKVAEGLATSVLSLDLLRSVCLIA